MGCGPSKPKTTQADYSQQQQYYNPVHYVSSERQVRGADQIVHQVHFVAHTVLASGGNHWTLYIQTGPQRSILINMDPGDLLGAPSPGHGYRGRMDVTLRNYAVTQNYQHIVSIPATAGHIVAEFIDAIIAAGNDEYDFTTEGRGCTGWMLDQYRLFVQQGLLQPGYNLESALTQAWVEGQATGPSTVTSGFNMRKTRGGGWGRRARAR